MLALEPCPRTTYSCAWRFFCSYICTIQISQITELVYAFQHIKQTNHYPSLNSRPSTHLLHTKLATFCSLLDLPLHPPWINWRHWLHSILFEPTPFLQTPQGFFPKFFVGPNLVSYYINFVLPKFILGSFSSILFFHLWIYSTSSSSLAAIKTKSSAYSSSIGRPSISSLDKDFSTMTKSSGLSTVSRWTLTLCFTITTIHSSARPIVLFTYSPTPIVFTSKFTDADSFTVTKQTWQ